MINNSPRCLAFTLQYEGGWSDNPRDPGGATMHGITLNTYRMWQEGARVSDLRNILPDVVASIYRYRYWNVMSCDILPAGLDLMVFDFGVNAGPGRSVVEFEQACGLNPDGKITEAVIARANSYEHAALIDNIAAWQMHHYRGLKTWPTFGHGWTTRTAARAVLAKQLAQEV